MRTVLTLAAAVVINASALAALEWNATTQAQLAAPAGEVTISQIDELTPLAPLAQAKVNGQVVRTASSL
jgi:hypothetical protein